MTDILHLSKLLGQELSAKGLALTTAESCTGGWAAQVVTAVEGSSQWFERGFVTYTNISKREMLGVSAETLDLHGAVSEETVKEMAEGAINHSHADIALSISGIAGPGGGSEEKPVGTVCFGWAVKDRETQTKRLLLNGERESVRYQSVAVALQGVLDLLNE